MANGEAVPKYTDAERRALVDQHFTALKTGTVAPEFAYKEITNEQDKKQQQGSVNDFFKKTLEKVIESDHEKFKFFDYDPRTLKYVPNIEAIVHFIHKRLHTLTFNDKVYTYDNDQGIYTQNIGVINALINEICRVCSQPEKVMNLQTFISPNLKGVNVYTAYPFDQTPYVIPFSNCTLRFDGGAWISEDKKASDLLTWSFDFPYDPLAATLPVQEVLESWVGKEDAAKLVDIPALALLQMSMTAPFKLNYLLVGAGDAGKSSYIDLLQLFFGRDKCGEVPLQQIGAKFTNAQLEGRMLNIFDDLTEKEFSNLGNFKKLTGRFYHPIEKKGEGAYEGLIRCVHLFSCNKVPVVNITDDDAFFSRWQPIMFPNKFERRPGWIKSTFTSEFLSGFANLVLNKYINILKSGLSSDFTPDEVREFWMRESSPEYSFIMDKMVMGAGCTIPSEECYKLYVKWMEDHKQPPSRIKNNVHFGKALSRLLIKSGQESASGNRYEVYKGIRLKVP